VRARDIANALSKWCEMGRRNSGKRLRRAYLSFIQIGMPMRLPKGSKAAARALPARRIATNIAKLPGVALALQSNRGASSFPHNWGRQYSRLRLRRFSVVDGSVVYETDGDRAPGDGATHSPAEMQRRAARERRIHGVAIDIAYLD